jgi:hypothetical protein
MQPTTLLPLLVALTNAAAIPPSPGFALPAGSTSPGFAGTVPRPNVGVSPAPVASPPRPIGFPAQVAPVPRPIVAPVAPVPRPAIAPVAPVPRPGALTPAAPLPAVPRPGVATTPALPPAAGIRPTFPSSIASQVASFIPGLSSLIPRPGGTVSPAPVPAPAPRPGVVPAPSTPAPAPRPGVGGAPASPASSPTAGIRPISPSTIASQVASFIPGLSSLIPRPGGATLPAPAPAPVPATAGRPSFSGSTTGQPAAAFPRPIVGIGFRFLLLFESLPVIGGPVAPKACTRICAPSSTDLICGSTQVSFLLKCGEWYSGSTG